MTTRANPSILLVEDNQDDVDLAMRAFTRASLREDVTVVRDGQEAVDYLLGGGKYADGRPELPRVVLLDLKLPKLSGHEVLRYIRADERCRLLPVVVLTSSNEERDILDSYRLGANSYVRKPVEFQEFRDAIGRLGLYWLGLNMTPDPL